MCPFSSYSRVNFSYNYDDHLLSITCHHLAKWQNGEKSISLPQIKSDTILAIPGAVKSNSKGETLSHYHLSSSEWHKLNWSALNQM